MTQARVDPPDSALDRLSLAHTGAQLLARGSRAADLGLSLGRRRRSGKAPLRFFSSTSRARQGYCKRLAKAMLTYSGSRRRLKRSSSTAATRSKEAAIHSASHSRCRPSAGRLRQPNKRSEHLPAGGGRRCGWVSTTTNPHLFDGNHVGLDVHHASRVMAVRARRPSACHTFAP